MNVSYPKGTKQIEGISEQTAKQNAWAWKKGKDISKKPASEDIRHSLLFTERTGWRNQGKCDGWNTQADKSHKKCSR